MVQVLEDREYHRRLGTEALHSELRPVNLAGVWRNTRTNFGVPLAFA